ncbi:ATP-binding protein [Pseudonocardia sp. CNS-139]|nr:ATP-binding protein [Pseudonocardia sp. CNS-139]
MEVKIGIAESARELVVSSDQTPDEVQALVDDALKADEGLLRLVDDKGRRYLIKADQIAYVEIAPAVAGRVGFAIG